MIVYRWINENVMYTYKFSIKCMRTCYLAGIYLFVCGKGYESEPSRSIFKIKYLTHYRVEYFCCFFLYTLLECYQALRLGCRSIDHIKSLISSELEYLKPLFSECAFWLSTTTKTLYRLLYFKELYLTYSF